MERRDFLKKAGILAGAVAAAAVPGVALVKTKDKYVDKGVNTVCMDEKFRAKLEEQREKYRQYVNEMRTYTLKPVRSDDWAHIEFTIPHTEKVSLDCFYQFDFYEDVDGRKLVKENLIWPSWSEWHEHVTKEICRLSGNGVWSIAMVDGWQDEVPPGVRSDQLGKYVDVRKLDVKAQFVKGWRTNYVTLEYQHAISPFWKEVVTAQLEKARHFDGYEEEIISEDAGCRFYGAHPCVSKSISRGEVPPGRYNSRTEVPPVTRTKVEGAWTYGRGEVEGDMGDGDSEV